MNSLAVVGSQAPKLAPNLALSIGVGTESAKPMRSSNKSASAGAGTYHLSMDDLQDSSHFKTPTVSELMRRSSEKDSKEFSNTLRRPKGPNPHAGANLTNPNPNLTSSSGSGGGGGGTGTGIGGNYALSGVSYGNVNTQPGGGGATASASASASSASGGGERGVGGPGFFAGSNGSVFALTPASSSSSSSLGGPGGKQSNSRGRVGTGGSGSGTGGSGSGTGGSGSGTGGRHKEADAMSYLGIGLVGNGDRDGVSDDDDDNIPVYNIEL